MAANTSGMVVVGQEVLMVKHMERVKQRIKTQKRESGFGEIMASLYIQIRIR